jgi:hypothetical protein
MLTMPLRATTPQNEMGAGVQAAMLCEEAPQAVDVLGIGAVHGCGPR